MNRHSMKSLARIVTYSALCIVLFSACSGPEKAPAPKLPAALGSLALARTIEGVEANKLIYSMHGKANSGSTSAVGYYGGTDANNVLYVSAFMNDEQAHRAFERMLSKMAEGPAGFSPPAKRPGPEPDIYETTGSGLKHFFFKRGNNVIWWQAAPGIADETFKSVLQTYIK
jgi:hypothetical protein